MHIRCNLQHTQSVENSRDELSLSSASQAPAAESVGDRSPCSTLIVRPWSHSPSTLPRISAHFAGRLSCVFPTEIVLVIWSMMTLKDLIMYGYTSKFNYEAVQAFLYRKRLQLIRPFFPNPQSFFRILKSTNSVVSGSLALAFMVPTESLGWFPNDMDLYTTKREVRAWTRYLDVCGYKPNKPSAVRPDGYPVHSEIQEIIYFENLISGRQVDLIISATIATKPMFCYHSTLVMNCFTGRGFFSAYPNLTTSLRGLMNPSTLVAYNIPPSHVAKCLKKYVDRGFSLAERPSAWAEDHHHCGRSWRCPEHLRHTGDRGCLFMDFRDVTENTEEEVTDTGTDDIHQAMLEHRRGVIWRLGGYSCDRRGLARQPVLDVFDLA